MKAHPYIYYIKCTLSHPADMILANVSRIEMNVVEKPPNLLVQASLVEFLEGNILFLP